MNPVEEQYFNDNSANLFSSYEEDHDFISGKETYHESSNNEKDNFEQPQLFQLYGQEQLRESYSTNFEDDGFINDFSSSSQVCDPKFELNQEAKQFNNYGSNNAEYNIQKFYGFPATTVQGQQKEQVKPKQDFSLSDFELPLPKIEVSQQPIQTSINPESLINIQRQQFEEQLNYLREYRRKQEEQEIETLKQKFEQSIQQQYQEQQTQQQQSLFQFQKPQATAVLDNFQPVKQEATSPVEPQWLVNSSQDDSLVLSYSIVDQQINQSQQQQQQNQVQQNKSKKINKKPKMNYKNQVASSETKNVPATIGNILINKLKEKLPEDEKLKKLGKVKTIQDLKDLFSLSAEIKRLCLYFLQSGPMLSYISSSTRIKQKRLIVKYIDVIIEGCIDTNNFGCLKKYSE